MPWRVRWFVLLVCVLAGATAVCAAVGSGTEGLPASQELPACLALALLVLLGELRPIHLTRGEDTEEVTLGTSFALALAFVGGLGVAMLAMCLSVLVEDVRTRKPPLKTVYNAAQYALSLSASWAVFAALSGQSVLGEPEPLTLPVHLPAALAAGCVFWSVNVVLTATVSALALDEPVLHRMRSDLEFQIATDGLMLFFAPVIAQGVQDTVWVLPLLVLPLAMIYASVDLAQRREAAALHDGLTGLPNRALFGLRVNRLCEQPTVPAPTRSAVMLLDLDHFKEINDTLGHHVGDELLKAVADRLRGSLRPGDTVARLGGDEFAVLAEDLENDSDALAVGERILAALGQPFSIDDVRLDVEGSLGIALHPEQGNRMDLLLRKADIALYAAKVERACVRLYDPLQDPHTLERLALAADLREGLGQGQLFLHHQPKVDARTGQVLGFEALVRWNHPQHGLLMPDDFLPVVENTGLIGPLTFEVLEMALTAVSSWRQAGHDVSVAVNLSVRHLTDLSLPAQIAERLAAHALPPEALVLEVTETLIMTDPSRAVGVLALLRSLGIGVAVDDFGTGYSSLAYLRRLQVDELKIDKSFVLQLAANEDDAVIVRSTIELGHNLGLRLVAEGVEDQASLDLLRRWGCDVAQGYFISRPMPDQAVLPWLSAYPDAPLARAALTG